MVPGILHCVEEMTASVFRQEVYPKDEKSGLLHSVGVCVCVCVFVQQISPSYMLEDCDIIVLTTSN